jgi:two-component system nitrogen regulation response regulator GlnG
VGVRPESESLRCDARLPVIVITAHGTTETAIEATKLGAFEFLLKPLDLDQLHDVVARAIHLSRIIRVPAMYDEQQEPQSDHTAVQTPFSGLGH